MSFDAEDIREELLDISDAMDPVLFPWHYRDIAELTRLLDMIEFLVLSKNEDWQDSAGLFVSKYVEQIAATELGRERLTEWLPIFAKSKHYDVHDDVAKICDALIPPGPK